MKNNIILATIDNINTALRQDLNALVCTRSGEINPAAAYIEMLRELLSLAD